MDEIYFNIRKIEGSKRMTACRVCGSSKRNDYFLITEFPSSAQGFQKSKKTAKTLKSDLDIFECSVCGLTQISNQPVSYYREVKRAAAYSEDMKIQRLKQFKSMLSLISNKKHIKAFEIGSGKGEYMEICKELGWEVIGIESSIENIQKSKNFSNNIINGFIGESNLTILKKKIESYYEEAKIDICYCLNFIEHWPNPKKCLIELKSLLSENTLCLFEVPNFNMIQEKGLYAEFIPDHLSYFNMNSFAYLIKKSGYEIIKLETFYNQYIISCYCKPIFQTQLNALKKEYFKDKKELKETIKEIEGDIYFWGAGHQSLAYLSMLGNLDQVKFVVDSAKFKQGFFCPGSGYEIKDPSVLENVENGNLIICCGGYNVEVIKIAKSILDNRLKIYTIENGHINTVN